MLTLCGVLGAVGVRKACCHVRSMSMVDTCVWLTQDLEVTAFEFAKSCSYTKAIAVLQNRGTIQLQSLFRPRLVSPSVSVKKPATLIYESARRRTVLGSSPGGT